MPVSNHLYLWLAKVWPIILLYASLTSDNMSKLYSCYDLAYYYDHERYKI